MLDANDTVLVLIDVQEKLLRAMFERDLLVQNTEKLLKGLNVLKVPVIYTEQNPAGLGPTVPEFKQLLGGLQPVSKMSFSACADAGFAATLKASGRKQVLVCGIEAHVCIYQTAVALREQGYHVEVVADCCGSRSPENKRVVMERMAAAGIGITTMEIVLFELLRSADRPEFRDISRTVK